jgi:hypothetical protein
MSKARNPTDTNLPDLKDEENKALREQLENARKRDAERKKVIKTLRAENAALKESSPRKWN